MRVITVVCFEEYTPTKTEQTVIPRLLATSYRSRARCI